MLSDTKASFKTVDKLYRYLKLRSKSETVICTLQYVIACDRIHRQNMVLLKSLSALVSKEPRLPFYW
jgi:hypothetical protein